jgi:hypothetical protein
MHNDFLKHVNSTVRLCADICFYARHYFSNVDTVEKFVAANEEFSNVLPTDGSVPTQLGLEEVIECHLSATAHSVLRVIKDVLIDDYRTVNKVRDHQALASVTFVDIMDSFAVSEDSEALSSDEWVVRIYDLILVYAGRFLPDLSEDAVRALYKV